MLRIMKNLQCMIIHVRYEHNTTEIFHILNCLYDIHLLIQSLHIHSEKYPYY